MHGAAAHERGEARYSIGDLAKRVRTSTELIRHYEKTGLMPKPLRSSGRHRLYTRAHADRLAFIRHARELGFSLDDVRTLLAVADFPDRSCEEADAIARRHLEGVRSRIARLQALEAELVRMVADCRRELVCDCRVIEVLADHSHGHCLYDDHRGTGL